MRSNVFGDSVENDSQRLSGDHATLLNAGPELPDGSAVMIFFCSLVVVCSSQSWLSLSWCATQRPFGDGSASQRSTLPSVVSCSDAPTPFAGTFHISTSPLSVESAISDLPSAVTRASRKRA